MGYPIVLIGAVLAGLLVSCAPAQTQSPDRAPGTSIDRPAEGRTLVFAQRYEPANLLSKVVQSNGPNVRQWNAALSQRNGEGLPSPYLAETLPELNTDTWRVFPDGRMETTYRLRHNLTWQDGAPLTAEDFAFAFRLYRDPGLGVFTTSPQNLMDGVVAPDPRTVIVQWRALNPDGGSLSFDQLDPVPQHILEPLFTDYTEGRSSAEALMANPFWTGDYVGAGPYRLEHWEPGIQLEGRAFSGHALGKPKIERIIVRIYLDENTTLAALLAGGQIDYASGNTLRFAQVVTLRREWEAAGKGFALTQPGTAVYLYLQQRPETVGHPALLDIRARRALAHAIDRQALNEGLFEGIGIPTESPVPPDVFFYPELDRLMKKYPLDLNRSSQLMSEAGFTRDGSGFYVDRQGRRFHIDFAVQSASEIERMQAILSDTWQQAGFEVRPVVIPPQVFSRQETRHTLPGLAYAFFQREEGFYSRQVGTAANNWAGVNRTGWTDGRYDRLYETWESTLELKERGSLVAQMMALASDYVPGYALYFSQSALAYVASLQGPDPTRESSGFGRTVRGSTSFWDLQNWTFR